MNRCLMRLFRIKKNLFFLCLIGGLVILSFCFSNTADAGSSEPVGDGGGSLRTQRSKQFVTHQPIISEMIAKVCETSSTDESLACHYVLLRYQSNALFYREAQDMGSLSNANVGAGFRVAGYFNDKFWNFSADGKTIETTLIGAPDLRAALEHVLYKASPMLNLGIFGSLPNSISWDGDKIRPFTNLYHVAIRGELTNSAGGAVTGSCWKLRSRGELFLG